MIMVKRYVWAVLDIIGMVILAAGALGMVELISLGYQISKVLLAAGVVLIIISSAFIQLEGWRLRKKNNEFMRFDTIRNDARRVPNDLEEPYLIDYTAEPSCAISYKNNGPKKETRLREHDEDWENKFLIIYSS